MVIGRTDRDELHEALIHARDRLGREVKTVLGSWDAAYGQGVAGDRCAA
jgi:hypothetical protein